MQTRAMAQSALGGKEAEQAYKDFVLELSNAKKEEEQDLLKMQLEKVKQLGAIKVTPLAVNKSPVRKR